jgi:hypothetical protein
MDSDIIDISNLNDDLEWNKPSTSTLKSANFGSGVELLMNDKKEKSKQSNDINIDELDNLENELNNLVDDSDRITYNNKSDIFLNSNSSSFSTNHDQNKHSVRFDSNIGEATADNDNSKTWDGYSKFNNIPLNPDTTTPPQQPQLNKEELLREKFKYLRKLETLESKGVNLTKKYSMESPLAEMQGEYEMIMEEKAKQNSVKFQGNMLMACINGIEFLNNRFDPFDIKLDGWSEQINENINDYDDVFAELYDKYKSRASLAPELKLLFQLGGSAMMVHMTNTMFKSAMPGVDDILRQNPDLMRSFQTAAVNSMSQNSPGFSGFMNNMMNNGPSSSSGPPPPLATQESNPPPSRPGNNNYSSMRNDTFQSNRSSNDGINIRENFSSANQAQQSRRQQSLPPQSQKRPEMKGPSDISDILSGLKTKTINIQEVNPVSVSINDNSTISIADLKELQDGGNFPKKSRRRQKSDKNTLSLDI